MGWAKIGWGKISGIFGLKALTLAFFLTPATVAAPPLATPAVAQIGIFIPGIRFYGGGATLSGQRPTSVVAPADATAAEEVEAVPRLLRPRLARCAGHSD